MIAITFDDGTCAACARRIVDYLLRAHQAATIFPNGRYATTWDPLASKIRRLVARGLLTVGNHTFNHVDAPGVGASAFGADLMLNDRWMRRTFGVSGVPYFRPPYGAYNAGTLAKAGADGYTRAVLWSGTVADSSPRSRAYILHAIRYWARPGAIILCHANYAPTSEALAQIFAILRRERLRPVTIEQLLAAPAKAAPRPR
jgi:peptidoglycan/xylan/chitin deacetylase (PgdA/CDA1 family)